MLNSDELMLKGCYVVCESASLPHTQTCSHIHALFSLSVLCFNGRFKQQQMAFSHCQQNVSSGPDRHVE